MPVNNLQATCLLIIAPSVSLLEARLNTHIMSSKKTSCKEAVGQAGIGMQTRTPNLELLEQKSMVSLENAVAAVRELSAARLEAKLSASRLTGVTRELRELIRVLSIYGC